MPRVVASVAVLLVILGASVPAVSERPGASASALDDVLRRVSGYVAAYGAQAAMFVGTETYDQRLDGWPRPRRLLAEFALVKAGRDSQWVGYRDVVKVDDQTIVDRRDRLLRLLSAPSIDGVQLKQIGDESARYNIGPISRNFNVPTTVLFFFDAATIGRFAFERKGTARIDGVMTWELEFKETRRPTLVRTRAARDVPGTGRLWVRADDGTVVRTRLELRDFADDVDVPPQAAAPTSRLVDKNVPGVGVVTTAEASGGPPRDATQRIESLAVIEVTYREDPRIGVWLPSKMSELYEGPMPVRGGPPRQGRSTGLAQYSDFKRFETSGRLVLQK
jgi:hypothetical protein